MDKEEDKYKAFEIKRFSGTTGITLKEFDPDGHLSNPESDFIFGSFNVNHIDYDFGPVVSMVEPLNNVIPHRYPSMFIGPMLIRKTVTTKVVLEKIAQLSKSKYSSYYGSVIKGLLQVYERMKK